MDDDKKTLVSLQYSLCTRAYVLDILWIWKMTGRGDEREHAAALLKIPPPSHYYDIPTLNSVSQTLNSLRKLVAQPGEQLRALAWQRQ